MKLNGMSTTAKWVATIITICIFFGGIILTMSRSISEETKNTALQNRNTIIEMRVDQAEFKAEVNTKLENIQDDVKEIKELVTK